MNKFELSNIKEYNPIFSLNLNFQNFEYFN